jgi:hypothetical protein
VKHYQPEGAKQDSDNLEKLQLEAGRIVTGLPLFASRQSINHKDNLGQINRIK